MRLSCGGSSDRDRDRETETERQRERMRIYEQEQVRRLKGGVRLLVFIFSKKLCFVFLLMFFFLIFLICFVDFSCLSILPTRHTRIVSLVFQVSIAFRFIFQSFNIRSGQRQRTSTVGRDIHQPMFSSSYISRIGRLR